MVLPDRIFNKSVVLPGVTFLISFKLFSCTRTHVVNNIPFFVGVLCKRTQRAIEEKRTTLYVNFGLWVKCGPAGMRAASVTEK